MYHNWTELLLASLKVAVYCLIIVQVIKILFKRPPALIPKDLTQVFDVRNPITKNANLPNFKPLYKVRNLIYFSLLFNAFFGMISGLLKFIVEFMMSYLGYSEVVYDIYISDFCYLLCSFFNLSMISILCYFIVVTHFYSKVMFRVQKILKLVVVFYCLGFLITGSTIIFFLFIRERQASSFTGSFGLSADFFEERKQVRRLQFWRDACYPLFFFLPALVMLDFSLRIKQNTKDFHLQISLIEKEKFIANPFKLDLVVLHSVVLSGVLLIFPSYLLTKDLLVLASNLLIIVFGLKASNFTYEI